MNERVARMRRLRLERLLGLLPRAYAAGAGDSALGAFLDALAGELAALDEGAERTLRNRWLPLAGGEPPWDEGPHPVERLGALVGVPREPWEDDPERFRRRLVQSTPILLGGPATVPGLLTLTAAVLDGDLCRRRVRDLDTTRAWVVRPGAVRACAGCRSPGGGACQYEAAAGGGDVVLARLRLTDNPVTARALEIPNLRHGKPFPVRNASLAADRPVVTLTALEGPVSYPALQNLRTGEITLFAGRLEPHDALEITPRRVAAEVEPFLSSDPAAGAPGLEEAAEGRALLLRGDQAEDVTRYIYYLRGDAFAGLEDEEGSRFADLDEERGAHFADLDRRCLTPLLQRGDASWCYVGYTREDIEALSDTDLSEVKPAELAPDPDTPALDLRLTWRTRPPATFRLTVSSLAEVEPDPVRREQVLSLLRRVVDRARGAGVRALLDVPELDRGEARRAPRARR